MNIRTLASFAAAGLLLSAGAANAAADSAAPATSRPPVWRRKWRRGGLEVVIGGVGGCGTIARREWNGQRKG